MLIEAVDAKIAQLVPGLRLGTQFLEALLRHRWQAEKRAQLASNRKHSVPDMRCEAELRNERKRTGQSLTSLGKPAIDWVMERQAITTDKASGITNDANLWATETCHNPRYSLEFLQRIITVSLETMKIVNSLPKLEID